MQYSLVVVSTHYAATTWPTRSMQVCRVQFISGKDEKCDSTQLPLGQQGVCRYVQYSLICGKNEECDSTQRPRGQQEVCRYMQYS